MNCPACGHGMDNGGIYLRGLGAAMFWSTSKDARFSSRKGLRQIDLNKIGLVPPRAQAIIDGWRCPSCGVVAFSAGELLGSS